MKLSNFSIPVIRDSFLAASSRFPLAVLSAVGFAIIAIYQIHTGVKDSEPELQRFMFTLAIAVPCMIGLHLVVEKYAAISNIKMIVFGVGFLFLAMIYLYIAPDFELERLERPVRFFSFFLMAHFFVAIVPFKEKNNLNEFWEYNKNLLINWFVGAFYVLIIFSGLSIALLAIDNLFDIRIDGKLYLYILIFVGCIGHPVYFLFNFPNLSETVDSKIEYTKAIRILVFYIYIPMSILYFVILYAYGIKILILWNLPKGWVSTLVLGFSAVGVFTYLLNYCLTELESNTLSKIFKKYFFIVLAPLVLLLFSAIFRRLSDYGFTPPRYFILITGIWLLFISIYFIISKSDNIKWIPTSLILFLLVGTMSPMDAFHVSSRSQKNRLYSKLETLGVMNNGRIGKSLSSLSYADKESIKEMLIVLDESGYLNKIHPILPDSISLESLAGKESKSILFEKLGLTIAQEFGNQTETIYLNAPETNAISIDGYAWMFLFNLNAGGEDDHVRLEQGVNPRLIFKRDIQDTILLHDLMIKIEDQAKITGNDAVLNTVFTMETKAFSYRFFIKQLNYRKNEIPLDIDYMHAIVLCKKRI
ncbi:MAG: DUF4153 domain-containing protein [Saprospiraceae bacterium]|nr:DUF4153 domain-containing protein [Saprospiraceae bacterium]